MFDHQLSLLTTNSLDAVDVNAVDHGVVTERNISNHHIAADELARWTVDDWVFGLGVTNWKAVVDRALQTGHFELFRSEEGRLGLRKHGYRYAPIPRLPSPAVTYIQQQLLHMAAARLSKQKKNAEHSHFKPVAKGLSCCCVVSNGVVHVQVAPGNGGLVSMHCSVDELAFSDRDPRTTDSLAGQFQVFLAAAGLTDFSAHCAVAKVVANHLVRLAASSK